MRTTKQLEILCIIPTLGHGGAQKVLVNLANQISKCKSSGVNYRVSILTFRNNRDNFYTVNGSIRLDSLDIVEGNNVSFLTIFRAPLKLRKFILKSNPDVILSFQDIANFPVLMATIGLNKHVIVSERQDTRFYSHATIRKIIRYSLYPMAAKIVVQTTLVEKQLPSFLKSKIEIIPNQVDFLDANITRPPDLIPYTAIAAGRLEDQKNFDLIIKAATHLKTNKKQWKIDIYGTGSLRDKLQSQIELNNLTDFVTLKGTTHEIMQKMTEADLFLFPSKYEGFPNALGEAVACGLPSIGFDNVSGNTDLIQHNKNGLLLNESERDPILFAKHVQYLIDNPKVREQFRQYCPKILPRFSYENIFEKWISVLEFS